MGSDLVGSLITLVIFFAAWAYSNHQEKKAIEKELELEKELNNKRN